MKTPIKYFIWIFMASIFLFYACKKDNNGPTEKFQIGVLLPLTGAASSSGQSASVALDIALRDLNEYLAATERPLEVELLVKDTGTHPDTALQMVKELHAAGVKYMIGPYTSANAEAVLSYANENGIIILSPSSVASTLAISGDNLYRLLPSDRSQAEAITALLIHDTIETVIPIVRNDVWGQGLLTDAGNIFSAHGIGMANAVMYDPSNINSSDIAAQVAALIVAVKNETPASRIAVYVLSFAEGTEILRAASQVPGDLRVNWYGSSAFANNSSLLLDDFASEFARAHNFRSPSFAPDSSAVDKWGPVSVEITSIINREPEVFALTTYDALWIMALTYVQTLDPDNLQQFRLALDHLTGYYNGITGPVRLDDNGDRKFASFNFWGIDSTGSQNEWKSFGYYNNADGELIIY